MKVTFYGGIALAAIAADKANAFKSEDYEVEELAQNSVGPMSTQVSPTDVYTQASSEAEGESTNLATIESDVEAHSEGELEAWSDASSESESASEGELEALSDSDMSDMDDDLDLAQCDAEAEVEGCPCRRWWWRRRRARILAWRRRMAILRARRLARIRAA